MSKGYSVAVLGATGLVGETLIRILEERDFPVSRFVPLASERSAGKKVRFRGEDFPVQDVAHFDFRDVQIGLFSAGASVSAVHAPRAGAAGCVVIDNTSKFRYDADIPLVVPEVNPEAIAGYPPRNIIANPNCSTIQMVVALKPIHDAAGITRINVATYQSVSGAGRRSVETLRRQAGESLAERPVQTEGAAKPIAFNVIPHIDEFQPNGYTKEEMKMVWETRKILGDESIQVNPTAVRVPVYYGHSEAVHIETRKPISAAAVRELLAKAPGVTVLDEARLGGYPTAVTEGAHRDAVFVGRIRQDISCERGIDLWVVADNIRKGAALNSIQIAEILVRDYF
ncbi:MAG: aspartate-semialdehyde dehydrogenase [Gammaproteobacteria bacterium]|nr:MAG: aspartate-semialdehyde dehydrogenase [Pseudomonadota bacterium]MBC6945317.1 aspartate-semialdehyde dehydrogenase [Gammaproteobacteria bacterium]MCE7895500.1 aspartate-semialdehyde dehydrogenase [Gammaproteobacteria bacterium PRO8]MDL1880549.1 aspartate-semialdehyde dehydrogenase [Gammaproteobacteria bacterium PRO2]MCQ3934265.1 aspartate-semialdehyde dehydrogenase [Gammaproteobacteria bacterium]